MRTTPRFNGVVFLFDNHMAVMQSTPGKYNPITGGYNLPKNAIGSKAGGGYLYRPPETLGASTSSGGGTSVQNPAPTNYSVPDPNQQARNQAEEEARRREEQARNEINSGYGQYTSNLQGLQSTYGTQRDDELASASRIYEQMFGGLEEQKATNLAKLDANRGNVENRQAQSIKDLQQNLATVSRGMSMQLGAQGAGDTSAANVMMPYAYTKLAGQQEGSIRNQSNDQLFQIDQQEQDTQLEFSNMWRQTEVDKETQLNSVKQYYGDAISKIQAAIAQAPLDQSRDLAALSQSLLSEAQANLRQLESEDRQRKEGLTTWATQRMSELNNAKLELSGSANFSPQDIVWSELQMMGAQPATGGQGEAFYNPMLAASKKRQEYGV